MAQGIIWSRLVSSRPSRSVLCWWWRYAGQVSPPPVTGHGQGRKPHVQDRQIGIWRARLLGRPPSLPNAYDLTEDAGVEGSLLTVSDPNLEGRPAPGYKSPATTT